MIQSRLFLLRDNNFINGALSDLKLCRMFSFTYTLHESSFWKIHIRGTLMKCIHKTTVKKYNSKTEWYLKKQKTKQYLYKLFNSIIMFLL